MAAAPLDPSGDSPPGAGSGSRRLFGRLHPRHYLSVLVGIVWVAMSVVILSRPPHGVSPTVWRPGFSWSPLIGLAVIFSAWARAQIQLTALGINRGRPRRQPVPWNAVAQLRVTASRDWFHVVPGLGLIVTSVDRVYPVVVTTGGELVPLPEIGYALSASGLERAVGHSETIAGYAGLPVVDPSRLDDYRSRVDSVDGSRWLEH